MNRRNRGLWVVCVAVSLSGCRLLARRSTETSEVDAGVATAATGAATVTEETIPAPQDFEEEAVEKVTPSNYKAELARLKKDIAPAK